MHEQLPHLGQFRGLAGGDHQVAAVLGHQRAERGKHLLKHLADAGLERGAVRLELGAERKQHLIALAQLGEPALEVRGIAQPEQVLLVAPVLRLGDDDLEGEFVEVLEAVGVDELTDRQRAAR